MKKYTYSTVYRGQQIEKIVCAKSLKQAAEKLGISPYTIRKYCYINDIDAPFDGIRGMFDSGMLYRKEKDLIRVEMPIERLEALIDSYKDREYKQFKNKIGIK